MSRLSVMMMAGMGKEDKHTKDENAIDIIDDVDEDIDKELSKYPEFKSDVID